MHDYASNHIIVVHQTTILLCFFSCSVRNIDPKQTWTSFRVWLAYLYTAFRKPHSFSRFPRLIPIEMNSVSECIFGPNQMYRVLEGFLLMQDLTWFDLFFFIQNSMLNFNVPTAIIFTTTASDDIYSICSHRGWVKLHVITY